MHELDKTGLEAAKAAFSQAESNPNLVPCSHCSGKGYQHGYGEGRADPDWCTSCGGGCVELVDGEEDRPLREALSAYLSTTSAGEPVGIKALEWEERSGAHYADTALGECCIDEAGDGFYVIENGRKHSGFATADAAKAFVQKNHYAWVGDWLEIRSALVPTTNQAHPDDLAVDRFAIVMKAKLAKKREEGRGGWDGPTCSAEILSWMLRKHVDKGDPVDVANLAMMLQQRGEGIAPGEPLVASVGLAQQVLDFFKAARDEGLYIGAGKDGRLPNTEDAQYGPLAKALLAKAQGLAALRTSAPVGEANG